MDNDFKSVLGRVSRDVDGIEIGYKEEARAISDRYQAVKDECDRLMMEADKERRESTVALNIRYRAVVSEAVKERAREYEHSEVIEAGFAHPQIVVGTPCHDVLMFNKSAVIAWIENAERLREEHERRLEENERMERRALVL